MALAVRVYRLVQVVVAVMVGPPEWAALDGGAGPDGEEELAETGRAVGLVGEVAVEDPRDREHADHVEGDRGPHGEPTPADPDDAEAGEVNEGVRHGADPVDAERRLAWRFRGAAAKLLGPLFGLLCRSVVDRDPMAGTREVGDLVAAAL